MAVTVPLETPTLGDRSYLVHDGETAFVVDPQRDVDRVLALADEHGVVVRDVFETHVHNDYVSGGPALAAATGARLHLHAADPVAYERHPVEDGTAVSVSDALTVTALATPGHTFTHLSYVLHDDGRPAGVFTGGSLLYGAVGRPDLLGAAHAEALARAQYRSAHAIAGAVPGDAAVYPTHGFGSFCSSGGSEVAESTVDRERAANTVLTMPEDAFVADLLAGLDAYPAYYAHMAPRNLAGAAAPDLSPLPRLTPDDVRRHLDAGHWVVDLRDRAAFARGHLRGTLNTGLDGNLATYLGWLIPWGTPVVLLGATDAALAEAQRELVRIGIDRPAGGAPGSSGDQTLRRVSFAEVAAERPAAVLDVRRRLEWEAGHVAGATHLPLHDLPARAGDVPPGEVWVHCATGYRAALAASLLAARGRDVVLVDDDFANAATAGVAIERGAVAAWV